MTSPPPPKRDGAATRQKLLRAGLELFTTVGFRATTTPEIAARAGVAEGTIYRHFSGKEDLLIAAYHEAQRWGLELVKGPDGDKILSPRERLLGVAKRLGSGGAGRAVTLTSSAASGEGAKPTRLLLPFSFKVRQLPGILRQLRPREPPGTAPAQGTDLHHPADQQAHRIRSPAHRLLRAPGEEPGCTAVTQNAQFSGGLAGHHPGEDRVSQQYSQAELGGDALGLF